MSQWAKERNLQKAYAKQKALERAVHRPANTTVRVDQTRDTSEAATLARLKADARRLGMNPEAIIEVARLKREFGVD